MRGKLSLANGEEGPKRACANEASSNCCLSHPLWPPLSRAGCGGRKRRGWPVGGMGSLTLLQSGPASRGVHQHADNSL